MNISISGRRLPLNGKLKCSFKKKKRLTAATSITAWGKKKIHGFKKEPSLPSNEIPSNV